MVLQLKRNDNKLHINKRSQAGRVYILVQQNQYTKLYHKEIKAKKNYPAWKYCGSETEVETVM